MSILPWLTVGASLLSGFMGNSNKTNSSTNQSTNSSSNTNSKTDSASGQVGETSNKANQTGTQNQAQTTTQNQNQQTRTDSFGNQISEQLAESIQQSTGQQVGSVNRLDDVTKSQLTQQVRDMMSLSGNGNDAMAKELARIQSTDPNFDADAYVAGIMGAATNDMFATMESDLGRMRDESGVAAGSNSAAKLLESRTIDAARANLAGVQANASAEAARMKQGLDESRTSQIVSATSGQNAQLQSMLGSLLNASQVESSTNTQNQTGTTKNTGKTSETSGTTGNTSTNTTGTSNTNTTTSQQETSEQKQRQAGTSSSQGSENNKTSSNTTQTGSATETEGGGWGGLAKSLQGMFSADW